MKMRQPDADITLTDGTGYFVEDAPYQHHLKTAVQVKEQVGLLTMHSLLTWTDGFQKPTCSNHKAAQELGSTKKNLDCTGVGGCACARHGCFVPHSMVDFQKGERYDQLSSFSNLPSPLLVFRQVNIDYAITQAAKYNTGSGNNLISLLLIYDIMCQWWVNFMKRVKKNPTTLTFAHFNKVAVAVGKFHLGAHVKKCFWSYSLNFIKGVGQIDGEIMETLWASFNKFASMTRSMSKAHRVEILNDHMRDVNWKKLVNMRMYSLLGLVNVNIAHNDFSASMLANKMKRTKPGMETTRDGFEDLSRTLPQDMKSTWQQQEAQAQERGGKALSIYHISVETGLCMPSIATEFY